MNCQSCSRQSYRVWPRVQTAAASRPALSDGRHNGPPRADARPAAVLLLVYPEQNRWCVPLMRRQSHLTQHAGQVSLPGGALEPGETTAAAAVREAYEELGIVASDVELLGTLSPLYVFNSNFLITPWLATAQRAIRFQPNPAEVAELIKLPLDVLQQCEASPPITVRRGRLEFSAPSLDYRGHRIWGATHVILGELGRMLRETHSS